MNLESSSNYIKKIKVQFQRLSFDQIVLLITFTQIVFVYFFFQRYALISQENIYFPSLETINNFNDQLKWLINTRNVNDLVLILGPFHYYFIYGSLEIIGKALNYFNIVQLATGLSIVLSPTVYYFSLKKYFNNNLFLFFASQSYILNPYFLERYISGHNFLIFTWPIYPILLRLYIDFIRKEKWTSVILIYIFSFFSIIFSGQFYLILLIFVIPILLVSAYFKKGKINFALKNIFLFILLSIPFLINVLYTFSISHQTVSLAQRFSTTLDSIVSNLSILNILTLSNSNFNYSLSIYGSIIIVYLIYSAALLFTASKKDDTQSVIISLIIISSVLLTLISPYLQIPLLRDLTKITLIYVILIPLLLYKFFEKIKSTRIALIISVIVIVLGLVPYFSNNRELAFTNVDSIDNSQYDEIIEFIGDRKTLLVPFVPDVRYIYNDPDSLTTTDFIQNNSGLRMLYKPYSNFKDIHSEIPESLEIQELNSFVKKYDVKFLYFRNDLDLKLYGEDYSRKITLLENKVAEQYTLVKQNKYARIYDTDINSELVNIKQTNSYGQAKIDFFEKLSPVEYDLKIQNLSDEVEIALLSNYDRNWKVYVNSEEKLNRLDLLKGENELNIEHLERKDYGNKWVLSKNDIVENFNSEEYQKNDDGSLNVKLKIYFLPQIYLDIALTIIMLSLVIPIAYLFILYFKGKIIDKKISK